MGVVVNAAGRLGDNSFLWHVRAGTLQLDQGQVLRSDPFSFTMQGESWRTQSWLAELLYGWLERATGGVGWHAMVAAIAGVLAIALVGLAVYAVVRSPEATALVLLPVMIVMFPALVPRPAVLALPLTAAVVLALSHRKLWWTVVPLIWVWAAVHGSFVFGLGLIVLEAVRHRDRRLGGVAMASAGVASLTAHGFAIWGILFAFLSNREWLGIVSEWETASPATVTGAVYLVVAAMAVAAAATRHSGRSAWLVAVPVAVFGFAAARNLAPAVIVLALPAATWLRGRFRSTRRQPLAVLNWALAVLIVGGSFAYLVVSDGRIDQDRFPQGVVTAMAGAPAFHDDAFGGYVIYAAWPDQLVFIDDRVELYGELFSAAAEAQRGEEYRRLFADYGLERAVTHRDGQLRLSLLRDGWVERETAGDYVLLEYEKAP
jgi:hypothetical protein